MEGKPFSWGEGRELLLEGETFRYEPKGLANCLMFSVKNAQHSS